MTRVGINGFGRVGRQLLQAMLGPRRDRSELLEVVAINDLMELEQRAYLLRHDTVYGPYPGRVEVGPGVLLVDGVSVPQVISPGGELPDWAGMGAVIVVDTSGRVNRAGLHLQQGVRAVVVGAPCPRADTTLVHGVNHQEYEPGKHRLISAASCTTTCVAILLKALGQFGLRRAHLDSVNAYTSSQRLVDGAAVDPRRARAAGANVIPTASSTENSMAALFPGLPFIASAFRAPVLCGSLASLWVETERPEGLTTSQANAALRTMADGNPTLLGYSEEPLVSSDIIGSTQGAVVDSLLTEVSGPWVHVVAWFDNEKGYAYQLADLVAYIAKYNIFQRDHGVIGFLPEEAE